MTGKTDLFGTDIVALARRQMATARAVHWALLLGVAAGLAAGPLLGLDWLSLVAMVAIFTWVLMLVRSARLLRPLRQAWADANVGRLEAAEARALELVRSWTLLRPLTLGAAQVLATVAHGRGRHEETAQLAAFVLNRRERLLVGDRVNTHLTLVEALVGLGQLSLARATALPLYAMKLQLPEALRLLLVQLRLEARLEAFDSMVERLASKVDMAELMPPAQSAMAHALLMLGARRAGLEQWALWLGHRVRLLADFPALQSAEPTLADVQLEGVAGVNLPAESANVGA